LWVFILEENYKKQIEDIIGQMECPKGFQCAKSGLKILCKAKELMALEDYLECLEEQSIAISCKFSIQFDGAYFCECPLRVYIAKHLRR